MTTRSELDRKFIAAIERLGRALRVARQDVATEFRMSLLQLQVIEHLANLGTRRVGLLADELDVEAALAPMLHEDRVDSAGDQAIALQVVLISPSPDDPRGRSVRFAWIPAPTISGAASVTKDEEQCHCSMI